MTVIVITKAFGSTSKVGTLIVALRSVESHDKALALSVVSLFTNLIGNVFKHRPKEHLQLSEELSLKPNINNRPGYRTISREGGNYPL